MMMMTMMPMMPMRGYCFRREFARILDLKAKAALAVGVLKDRVLLWAYMKG